VQCNTRRSTNAQCSSPTMCGMLGRCGGYDYCGRRNQVGGSSPCRSPFIPSLRLFRVEQLIDLLIGIIAAVVLSILSLALAANVLFYLPSNRSASSAVLPTVGAPHRTRTHGHASTSPSHSPRFPTRSRSRSPPSHPPPPTVKLAATAYIHTYIHTYIQAEPYP